MGCFRRVYAEVGRNVCMCERVCVYMEGERVTAKMERINTC